MKNKKGNIEPSQNLQTVVDVQSKLICSTKVFSEPTDHNLLPKSLENAINNTKQVAKYISADYGYYTKTSMDYLREQPFQGLIPNKTQTRLKTGRLSENPYHKDHFYHDCIGDCVICLEGEVLFPKIHISHKYKEK